MSKLVSATDCAIILIDVQEKLLPVMSESEQILKKITLVLELAIALELPVIVSQQYAKGLGETVDKLQLLLSTLKLKSLLHIIEKTKFSLYDDAIDYLKNLDKRQLIIMGIESHICVLQSAVELSDEFDVFVVEDTVSSTQKIFKDLAIDRLGQLGIQIINTQMLGFELLGGSHHTEFKNFSKKI